MILLNLMLSQIVWPVLVLARASGERTLENLGRLRAVLQLLVFGHAALEPLGVTLRSITADLATCVGFHLLLLGLLLC